ncbi:MAG: thiamine diphosphokinase [Chloroflexia bacterium]
MKALVIANGVLEDTTLWEGEIGQAELIVAADGGARHARSLGLRPDAVVGDGDSLDAETARWLEEQGVLRVAYPADKDETDLELALLYAVRAGAGEILVLGAQGGRPDQMLANLLLLAHPDLAGCRVRLLGAAYQALVLRGGEEVVLRGRVGDTLSLLPLSEARGVHASGLRWSLGGDTFPLGPARGISNELTSPQARISLEEGLLLIVHLRRSEEVRP